MKRVVVMISGRGSNLKALIAAQNDKWKIVAVISDRDDAPGFDYAFRAGIPVVVADKCAKDPAWLIMVQPDLVVLAGFMRVLDKRIVQAFKIINIHPSLLPKYPGLDTHRQVLEAGDPIHGATVHWVDAGVDTGEIIEQVVVPVLPGDTAEVLAARVLEQEHKLLVSVVNRLCGEL